MGAHDLDALEGEIAVRFSRKGHLYTTGEETAEILEDGELVYADAKRIRTRRWIWRQSEMVRLTKIPKISFFLSMDFSLTEKKSSKQLMNWKGR